MFLGKIRNTVSGKNNIPPHTRPSHLGLWFVVCESIMLQGIATVDTVNLTSKDDILCTIYDKFVFNIVIHAYCVNMNTPGRRQSKTPKIVRNSVFDVICRPTGDK